MGSAPSSDLVTSLPGWEGPLPSPWYSGYLSFGRRHLHYVLVQAETPYTAPAGAPLVLWMNGGPGCSSLDALFYEHGPLLVNVGGTALVRNPFAWAKVANVLYLEAPIGVGYSYSEEPRDTMHLNDEQTATDNLQALKAFFTLFPEYKQSDFYVSGESYAGVYVPTLSLKIFLDKSVDWNMKGFIVGNGIMDYTLLQQTSIPFLYGHGAISSRDMEEIDSVCHGDYVKSSFRCHGTVSRAEDKASFLNVFDFYRDCFHSSANRSSPLLTGRRIAQQPKLLRSLIRAPRPPHPALSAGSSPPCVDTAGGTAYLGKADVRAALHIKDSLPPWTICSDIGYSVNKSFSAAELYRVMKDQYKILVYNGDTDMSCNYLTGAKGVDAVGAEVDGRKDWAPWTMQKDAGVQNAGWLTGYSTTPGMFFLTVKGAGHLVPQWKPAEALEMLRRFLLNKDMQTGGTRSLDGAVSAARAVHAAPSGAIVV